MSRLSTRRGESQKRPRPKPKKCKAPSCKETFVPWSTLQDVCSTPCAIEIAREREAKKARRERQQARARLKTRSDWTREAQAAFNAWIRERDHALPCVSCGRFHNGQWHAGHYRTTKAHPELRFEPLNVHKQCAPCNNHKSGDIVNFRLTLVQRIGTLRLAWLEGPHEPKRYTIDDLREIRDHYRAKARELKKRKGA